MHLRRAFALFVPAAVLATGLSGLIYVVAQQDLRSGANDPQEQLAGDAAGQLNAGAAPTTVVTGRMVDVATSLAPFVVVYDSAGKVVASDGQLNGAPPLVPSGVLASAHATGRDAVTWQPLADVRIATVSVPWTGGTVMVGRSLRLVEERESRVELLVGAGWLAILVGLAAAAALASWMWPEPPSRRLDG
jgi:hypothetical protein